MSSSKFYTTYAEWKSATLALKITSLVDYRNRYKGDPKLPSNPRIYDEFISSGGFKALSPPAKADSFYTTYAEWKSATLALKITSRSEYLKLYKQDPKLPSNPDKKIPNFWENGGYQALSGFEGFYANLDEWKAAVSALGITSWKDYQIGYKADPKLPSNPFKSYADFSVKGGFKAVFSKRVDFYPTFDDWKTAVIALDIVTWDDYKKRYKEDPKLPSAPSTIYEKFSESGGFKVFSLIRGDVFYATYEEWKKAVAELKIASLEDYKKRHKQDPKLPSSPYDHYENFTAMGGFKSVTPKINNFYKTYDEWKNAAIKLKITSWEDYKERYKDDPKLPSVPSFHYKDFSKLGGLKSVLPKRSDYYATYDEWVKAVIALNITSWKDYNKRYKEDPRLTSNPYLTYKEYSENGGLKAVLSEPIYATYEEWEKAVIALGITKSKDYKARYKEDPKLPFNPVQHYIEFIENGGFKAFSPNKTS